MKIELTYLNVDFDSVNVSFKLDGLESGKLRLKHDQVNALIRILRFGIFDKNDSLTTYGSRSPSTAREK